MSAAISAVFGGAILLMLGWIKLDLDRRFNRLEERVDRVADRTEQLAERLAHLEGRLDTWERQQH